MTTRTALFAATAAGALAVSLTAAPASAAPSDAKRDASQAQSRKARIVAMKRQLLTLPGGRRLPLRNFSVGAGFGHSSGPHAGRKHAGLDLGASTGTHIYSATEGRVIMARRYYGYGNLVIVRTSSGRKILYAHQSRMLVRKGQYLRAGQKLGKVGSTGYSTGPHLHFEVRNKRDNAVNPLRYLGVNRRALAARDRKLDRLR